MLNENGMRSWTYTNAAFLSSQRHNLPSKLKLRNNQTARNVYMWMQQLDFQKVIFTFPTIDVCRPGSSQASVIHAKMARSDTVEFIILRV